MIENDFMSNGFYILVLSNVMKTCENTDIQLKGFMKSVIITVTKRAIEKYTI